MDKRREVILEYFKSIGYYSPEKMTDEIIQALDKLDKEDKVCQCPNCSEKVCSCGWCHRCQIKYKEQEPKEELPNPVYITNHSEKIKYDLPKEEPKEIEPLNPLGRHQPPTNFEQVHYALMAITDKIEEIIQVVNEMRSK